MRWLDGITDSMDVSRRGSGSTRYLAELEARASGNIVVKKGMATSISQYAPIFFPGEPPPAPNRERCQATLYRVTKSWTQLKRPCVCRNKVSFCLWQLCPSES